MRATQAVTERALGLAEVVVDTVIGPTRPAGASSSGSSSVDLDGEVIDEVHVAEPWDGYRQLNAADVADRIIGADPAELAAVELYELSSRRRQTVLDAVARELERTQAGDQ